MANFQDFVSAMGSTALIVAIARLVLGFVLKEPKNYVPALCVGLGFLLGHYPVSGSLDDPDTVVEVTRFLGSAACIVISGAGFRYRTSRTNVS